MTRRVEVSVVTPVFNGEKYLGDAIDSVLSQDVDLEMLVVDDGSEDGSRPLAAARAAEDARLRPLENVRRSGPAGARNTGIEAARGRYIAFLDCDDLWYPGKLVAQIDRLREPGVALTYSSFDLVGADGVPLGVTRHAPERVDYATLLRSNVIGCLTAMFDTERAGRPLMPDLPMRQDWGLWLRILRETGTTAVRTDPSLGALRVRPGSLSSSKLRASWYSYRLLSEIEGLHPVRAAGHVVAHNLWRLRSTTPWLARR